VFRVWLVFVSTRVSGRCPRRARDAGRWAAHFFSEGNAARAQMEQIKQEKNKKQAKRQGATHDKR